MAIKGTVKVINKGEPIDVLLEPIILSKNPTSTETIKASLSISEAFLVSEYEVPDKESNLQIYPANILFHFNYDGVINGR